MEKRNSDRFKRFNHLLAWFTLMLFVLFILTGYGITNPKMVNELTGGILTRGVSLNLHMMIAFPVLALLTVHIVIGAKSALARSGVKEGKLLYAFLILLGVFALTLLALMQYVIL
jgi:thiosulfate reductase cytochrome b subunit